MLNLCIDSDDVVCKQLKRIIASISINGILLLKVTGRLLAEEFGYCERPDTYYLLIHIGRCALICRAADEIYCPEQHFKTVIIGLDIERFIVQCSIWPSELNKWKFFLWDYLKYRLYLASKNTLEDLKNKINN